MILLIVSLLMLAFGARLGSLPGWGWWLGLVFLAWVTDNMLMGAALRAPRPTKPVEDVDRVIHDAHERLARMRANTERTLAESDRIAAESRATVDETRRQLADADAAYAEWRRTRK